MKKFLLALMLLSLVVSAAGASVTVTGLPLGAMTCDCAECVAHPLYGLKTTFEQSHATITSAQRTGSSWSPVWTRMQRTSFGSSASATNLPNGYDPRGEVIPFSKLVAEHSGGRIRYETMGYSARGVPQPLLVVGIPYAPISPEDALTNPLFKDRARIRIQGNIHGGENDGKEATLIFLRGVAMGKYDDLLKDVILLVSPTANPDGLNAQTREFANGSDPNRNWGHAVQPEIRNALRLYRMWDPHIVVDQHNIGSSGLLSHRHIITWTNGKQGNNDPEIDWENTSFAEASFGGGHPEKNPYFDIDSLYMAWMNQFIEEYSPPVDNPTASVSSTGKPVYSLGNGTIGGTRSPQRNRTLSHIAMPYMEGVNAARNAQNVWEAIAFPNPGSDSVRSTATVPIAMNKFSVLVEIVNSHHRWLQVNSMHAMHLGIIDVATKNKETLLGFFNDKADKYGNLNNDSPMHLKTVFQGAIDYRNNVGSNTGDGGNSGAPYRKIMPMLAFDANWKYAEPWNGFDHGYGHEIWKYEGYHYGTGTSASSNLNTDYVHYPRAILNNIPQWPIQMGAFYVLDARATTAVDTLLRFGIPVYKLTKDVMLPHDSTYKMYGVDSNGYPTENWGVTQNQFMAYNLVRTVKLPRNRADVIDNYSTEANKVSPNYATVFAGQAWVPLTSAQTPNTADAPTFGGGEWFSVTNHVAPAGHFVVPTAHKLARFIGFKMEPRANCGTLFWGHYNDAVTNFPNQFDLDLVKTFDYTAINVAEHERLYYPQDLNPMPDRPFGPSIFNAPAVGGATVVSAIQDGTGDVTVTIKTAVLHDDMWLTFYFYDEATESWMLEEENAILKKVRHVAPGVFEAFFTYAELAEAGLEPGSLYAIQYTNVWDIFGYSAPNVLNFDNPVVKVMPSAEVIKLNGNKNTLIITVKEIHAGGEVSTLVVNFSIDNNAAATYVVGPYKVYVDTKGNTQIRECYIVK